MNQIQIPAAEFSRAARAIVVALVMVCVVACDRSRNPMLNGQNPTSQNPSRLSGTQQDALIEDVSQKFNQINMDYTAGNMAVHIKKAMAKVQSNPSLIQDETLRRTFLAQNPAVDAHSTCTLEVLYFLLKYSGANVGSFEDYYINAVNKGYVTGDGTKILDFVAQPAALISQYTNTGSGADGLFKHSGPPKNFELVTFNNTQKVSEYLVFSRKEADRKKNFMDFVGSGVALGHFRIDGHSLIGYWDRDKLRRADSYHIRHERQIMNGQVVVDTHRTRPVQLIEIVRLKGATAAAPDPNYQADGGVTGRAKDTINNFLQKTTAGHILVVLIPTLLGFIVHFGRKEYAKIKPHLASLQGLEKKVDQVLEKIVHGVESAEHAVADVIDPGSPASLLREAKELMANREYAEALPILEKCVARDSSDAVTVALLLEMYLIMGEADRYRILYSAHRPAVDALEGGNLAAYLEILRAYHEGSFPEMERDIAAMNAKTPPPRVRWNFEPVLDFFKLRPNSRQKDELVNFITRLAQGGTKAAG